MSDRLGVVREGRTTERAARTQDDILEVATAEFAANGYAGSRVDEIAARTRTTKRMIYYYFGSKEGLYLAVLERVYAQIRRVERGGAGGAEREFRVAGERRGAAGALRRVHEPDEAGAERPQRRGERLARRGTGVRGAGGGAGGEGGR